MKKTLLIIFISLFLSSCGWFSKEPEIVTVLAEHFKNKLYKKFDTVVYDSVFKEKLADYKAKLVHPNVTRAFYEAQNNQPVWVTKFYTTGALDTLIHTLLSSKADGLNPEAFDVTALKQLKSTLDGNTFKNIAEVYPIIAELEIKSANAFLKYQQVMKYGCVNPRNIFNRYYIVAKRQDSLTVNSLLKTDDMISILHQVQPKNKAYLDLKNALANYRDSLKTDDNEAIRKIKLNLERLRWPIPIQTEERVVVNIPDFSLTWFRNNDTLAHMNVCVGAKREATYTEKMKLFLKTGKLDDKPKNHETPQLVSVFNAIQVNPIWNIPVSIAKSEIYYQIVRDPYYLSNNNIKVYYKGKEIKDPDTIRWSRYPREKLPFQFKQGSGEGNALGKFKFVFDNSSSIYLHDTNNKYGFKLANRAISHGCVRIEDPLKFAELMVKDKYQYDKLRMEVNLPPLDTTKNALYAKILAKKADTLNTYQLKPTWFATRKNVAVVIAYYTAWAENGKVQFRPDVYQYDETLWNAMRKYL